MGSDSMTPPELHWAEADACAATASTGIVRAADPEAPRAEENINADRREERQLSGGAAVQFIHRGKTVHGHLLQRQGAPPPREGDRCRGANLRIAESALKTTGRARRV